MGLLLTPVDVQGPLRWRWLLIDEESGQAIADHLVDLASFPEEVQALADLHQWVSQNAAPDRRVSSERDLVARIGDFLAEHALGTQVGQAILRTAPETVRVLVPPGTGVMELWPWEAARIDGTPLACSGEVSFVHEQPTAAGLPRKRPIGEAVRVLAVFSLPSQYSVLALRRERYALSRLVRQLSARTGARIDLEVAQYGTTRTRLRVLAEDGEGWDVLHLSGHGGTGQFVLETETGAPDTIGTAELVALLRPTKRRVKLAVLSACQSGAGTTAHLLRWLGLAEQARPLEQQAQAELEQASREQAGLAQVLTDELQCAALAMRYPVVDDFAIALADQLYSRLFDRRQTVDQALARALSAALAEHAWPSPGCPALSVATPALIGASACGLSLDPPRGEPDLRLASVSMSGFPPEPGRFVGRTSPMAAASTALAPRSGRAGVLFHGMAGAGKTACALELAYRHRDVFTAHAFWQAPSRADQFGAALVQLARAWENQLGAGFSMAGHLETAESFAAFLPRLRVLLRERGILLVLDNLDSLLSADGTWRDPRWQQVIETLVGHGGESRVVLTSRCRLPGLDDELVLQRPVHALSLNESLLLIKELPRLGRIAAGDVAVRRGYPRADVAGYDVAGYERDLIRTVLTLVQGHPKLLELADAAAADVNDPDGVNTLRLSAALERIRQATAAEPGGPLEVFLTDGDTALDDEGFWTALTTWTRATESDLPHSARLLLQVLCRLEESDRREKVLTEAWPPLWTDLWEAASSGSAPDLAELVDTGTPQQLPSLARALDRLVTAAVVEMDSGRGPDGEPDVVYRIHPGIAEVVQNGTAPSLGGVVDLAMAAYWADSALVAFRNQADRVDGDPGGSGSPCGPGGADAARAGIAAAPYLIRLQDWEHAGFLLQNAYMADRANPATLHATTSLLRQVVTASGDDPRMAAVLASVLSNTEPDEAERHFRAALTKAAATGDARLEHAVLTGLVNLLQDCGRPEQALTLIDERLASDWLADQPRLLVSARGQRVQILSRLGRHEEVLAEAPELLRQLDVLGEHPEGDLLLLPPSWMGQELLLEAAGTAASALRRWDEALRFNDDLGAAERRRGAGAYEQAVTRYNRWPALVGLGRTAEAEDLLLRLREVFAQAEDHARLGKVYTARAALAELQGRHRTAVDLERTALRHSYQQPDPRDCAQSHFNLGSHLLRADGPTPEQRAHRLAAALLFTLLGDQFSRENAVRALAQEQPPGARPQDLATLIDLVDAEPGVRFADLLQELVPDPGQRRTVLAGLLDSELRAR